MDLARSLPSSETDLAFGFLPYRPYAEGNLSRADGLSYDAHERILDEVSQWRERIRSHIVRRLSRVISLGKSHNLLTCKE